jgi:hypothetical protein
LLAEKNVTSLVTDVTNTSVRRPTHEEVGHQIGIEVPCMQDNPPSVVEFCGDPATRHRSR